jgi:uncharacterized membrane protein SpoIIM required for sporulation
MRNQSPVDITEFAARYRAACADLALADSYQLPPGTVRYLHQLVGRAHNQLYRSRKFNFSAWRHEMLVEVPARLVRDRILWLAMAIFWGTWIVSMGLAYYSPGFAERMMGVEQLESMRSGFAEPLEGRNDDANNLMIGFYIWHNAGIGLQCFAAGMLLGVGGLFVTIFNSAHLGTAFGYMATVPEATNFYHFVTAHGPFELTAIVLSAAAGMRLGFSLIDTQGVDRVASLRAAGRRAMPTICAAVILFAAAGLIEAFLSPSAAPYWVKATVAVVSTLLLLFYIFVLGLRPRSSDATR